VGVGTEILFMITLGLVVLGPKRLHSMMGHVARAKAELENATRSLKAQLGADFNEPLRNLKTDCSQESRGGPVNHTRNRGIGTANAPPRFNQAQSSHAAGYQGERIQAHENCSNHGPTERDRNGC
jgi:Sec-independent protein translocase protein TatA